MATAISAITTLISRLPGADTKPATGDCKGTPVAIAPGSQARVAQRAPYRAAQSTAGGAAITARTAKSVPADSAVVATRTTPLMRMAAALASLGEGQAQKLQLGTQALVISAAFQDGGAQGSADRAEAALRDLLLLPRNDEQARTIQDALDATARKYRSDLQRQGGAESQKDPAGLQGKAEVAQRLADGFRSRPVLSGSEFQAALRSGLDQHRQTEGRYGQYQRRTEFPVTEALAARVLLPARDGAPRVSVQRLTAALLAAEAVLTQEQAPTARSENINILTAGFNSAVRAGGGGPQLYAQVSEWAQRMRAQN